MDLPSFLPPPRVTPVPHDSPLRWLVPSASKAGESHLVELDSYFGNGRCSCPDFTCRLEPEIRRAQGRGAGDRTRCKHIRLTRTHFLDRVILKLSKAARVLVLFLASAAGAAPSDALLDSLAWAESRNRPETVADGGLARGAYCFHLAAWIDAQEAARRPLGPWEVAAHCPQASRAAAAALMGLYESRLRRLGLEPTPARLWLAWTMGWSAARKIGFNPANAPAHKRRGLARLTAALAGRPATN